MNGEMSVGRQRQVYEPETADSTMFSQPSAAQTNSSAPYNGRLLTVSYQKKVVDHDAQVLANRIALLRKEEEKAMKKIDKTKERVVEIHNMRLENERRAREREMASKKANAKLSSLRKKNHALKITQITTGGSGGSVLTIGCGSTVRSADVEGQSGMASSPGDGDPISILSDVDQREFDIKKKRLEDMRNRKYEDVQRVRLQKQALRREHFNQQHDVVYQNKLKREAVIKAEEASRLKREEAKKKKEEETKRAYEARIKKQEGEVRRKEREVAKMERLELGLIERLKTAQVMQHEAFQDLEKAVRGETTAATTAAVPLRNAHTNQSHGGGASSVASSKATGKSRGKKKKTAAKEEGEGKYDSESDGGGAGVDGNEISDGTEDGSGAIGEEKTDSIG